MILCNNRKFNLYTFQIMQMMQPLMYSKTISCSCHTKSMMKNNNLNNKELKEKIKTQVLNKVLMIWYTAWMMRRHYLVPCNKPHYHIHVPPKAVNRIRVTVTCVQVIRSHQSEWKYITVLFKIITMMKYHRMRCIQQVIWKCNNRDCSSSNSSSSSNYMNRQGKVILMWSMTMTT